MPFFILATFDSRSFHFFLRLVGGPPRRFASFSLHPGWDPFFTAFCDETNSGLSPANLKGNFLFCAQLDSFCGAFLADDDGSFLT